MRKIIIEKSMNVPPCVDEQLEQMGDGWKIISATTALAPYGNFGDGSALHVYYVTTVVLEKTNP